MTFWYLQQSGGREVVRWNTRARGVGADGGRLLLRLVNTLAGEGVVFGVKFDAEP
jgi:hypothetical protein